MESKSNSRKTQINTPEFNYEVRKHAHYLFGVFQVLVSTPYDIVIHNEIDWSRKEEDIRKIIKAHCDELIRISNIEKDFYNVVFYTNIKEYLQYIRHSDNIVYYSKP